MTPRRGVVVEADGGSRGNPGVAGYGALVRDPASGALLAERAEPLGTASNNVAEYRGLIAGLEAARDLAPGADVEARMDSKLVVEQMSGRWKIKHADMRRLALLARDVVAEIEDAGGAVTFTWIPRAENADADALSNVGMDGETVHLDHLDQLDQLDHLDHLDHVDTTGAAPGPGETTDDPADDAPAGPGRVLLVAELTGDAAGPARSAGHLVRGGAVTLVTAPTQASVGTAGTVGDALDTVPAAGAGWDDPARAASLCRGLLHRGGTSVVVCPGDVVRAVVVDVLGVPRERARRLAVAPGSLTAVQVAGDDEPVVAFTNRT